MIRNTTVLPITCAMLLAIGCASKPQWSATLVRTTEGVAIPECVVVDPATGAAYVSNIETSTEGWWDDDGKGSISRLTPDGSMDQPRWRNSSSDKPIHSPKGMCIVNNILYVADNTRILRFSLPDGNPMPLIAVPGAKQLNDMASDGRTAWASDTETGNIFRLGPDGPKAVTNFKSPNGIAFHKGRMYAVSWDGHDVYELDPAGRNAPRPFGLSRRFTNLDGIEMLEDGTLLVSDFTANKICTVSYDGKKVKTLVTLDTPADIGLDRQRNLLYVPLFMKNQVAVYKLSKD